MLKFFTLASCALFLGTIPLVGLGEAQTQVSNEGPFDGIHTRFFANKKKVANSCTGSGDGCCVSTSSGGNVWVYNCTVTVG